MIHAYTTKYTVFQPKSFEKKNKRSSDEQAKSLEWLTEQQNVWERGMSWEKFPRSTFLFVLSWKRQNFLQIGVHICGLSVPLGKRNECVEQVLRSMKSIEYYRRFDKHRHYHFASDTFTIFLVWTKQGKKLCNIVTLMVYSTYEYQQHQSIFPWSYRLNESHKNA